jgi:hypothetical protein
MKVSKLIKQLQKLDPNSEVILQVDEEGNGYSPVRGVEEAIQDENGTVYDPRWSASDDCLLDADVWKKMKKNKKLRVAIVFP